MAVIASNGLHTADNLGEIASNESAHPESLAVAASNQGFSLILLIINFCANNQLCAD